ncbi:hypothetical protein MMC22_003371 [Lobaria immixta]|nr:hypothetical protein [Lobaria immixta]
MFLPKLAVTAYLALQSQKAPTENRDSLQQGQSPLHDVSRSADYVIEITGQPLASEHVDVEIPHGQTLPADHRAPTSPHTLAHTYHSFDDLDTGKVDISESSHGASLSGGYIYDISKFPNVPNEFGVQKFWGIPTGTHYKSLTIKLNREVRSFALNIGYIRNGNLTAASFDVWHKHSNEERDRLSKLETWNNLPWLKSYVGPVNEVTIVLTGFFARSGILAFYDWGYED